MNILDYVNRGFIPYFMIDLTIKIDRAAELVHYFVPNQPDTFISFEISHIKEDIDVWAETSEAYFQEIFDWMLSHGFICVGRLYSDIDLEYLLGLENFKAMERLIQEQPKTNYNLYQIFRRAGDTKDHIQLYSTDHSEFQYLEETLQYTFEMLLDNLDRGLVKGYRFAPSTASEKEVQNGDYFFQLVHNPNKLSQFECIFA